MAHTKGGSHSLISNSLTNIPIIILYFKKMDQLRPGTVDSVRNAANSLAVSEFQPYSNSLKDLSVPKRSSICDPEGIYLPFDNVQRRIQTHTLQ